MNSSNPYKRIAELERTVNTLKLAFLLGILFTDLILLAGFLVK